MDKLTPKQKAFADEYLKCGNATEAARKAGYNEKSARQIATENLSKPSISAYIAERQKQIEDSRIADVAEVMQFFTRILRNEEKNAFGLDLSAADRMSAGREILKRYKIRKNTYGNNDKRAYLCDHKWIRESSGNYIL